MTGLDKWGARRKESAPLKQSAKIKRATLPALNLLVLGKTGAGKTSLINYLFGTELRAGAGRPVTERGIHEQIVAQNGIEFHVFDTWGLEAGEANEWMARILNEAAERNSSPHLEKWFHGVFYCLNASAARVENLEAAEIIAPLWRQHCPVTVVLTHAAASINKSEKICGLAAAVLKELRILLPDFPAENIVPVSSVEGETFAGDRLVRFGRDELLAAAEKLLRQNLSRRVPPLIHTEIKRSMTAWSERSGQKIAQARFGFLGRGGQAAKLIKEIDEDLKQTYALIDSDALRLRRQAACYTHAPQPLPGCHYKKFTLTCSEEHWSRYLRSDNEIKTQLRKLIASLNEKVCASIVEGTTA